VKRTLIVVTIAILVVSLGVGLLAGSLAGGGNDPADKPLATVPAGRSIPSASPAPSPVATPITGRSKVVSRVAPNRR
jgi:hypothetical protein